jgi:hypothetical protein
VPFNHKWHEAKKAKIVAAVQAASLSGQCRRKEKVLTAMLKAISNDKVPFAEEALCSFDQALDTSQVECDVAAAALSAIDASLNNNSVQSVHVGAAPANNGKRRAINDAKRGRSPSVDVGRIGQSPSSQSLNAEDRKRAQYAADPGSVALAQAIHSRTVSDDGWPSAFSSGSYVEIIGAERRPEFNGQRARLYARTETEGMWYIRILGKNEGLYRCREDRFKQLHSLEQSRSRPSPAQAGFDDVGIDPSGQPNSDSTLLAHRQFGAEYSAELTARIEALKARYPNVFTDDVTEACLFEPMDIKLIPNAILPTKARFYRNTPKMKEEVRRQIQQQLSWDAIRASETPHVSDVLLVKRPHMPGKWRFVVNFKILNDATVAEQLIMPDPHSQHERLAGKRIFGAMDFSSYYRQLRLKQSCQYLTGFASDEGTFVHTRVPMGLKNACAYS